MGVHSQGFSSRRRRPPTAFFVRGFQFRSQLIDLKPGAILAINYSKSTEFVKQHVISIVFICSVL